MKKLCIVPFTKSEMPLLEPLKKQYIIRSLISPKGIGFEGEDVSILRNWGKTGFTFTNQIEQGIECCDTVLVSDISKSQKSLRAFAISAFEEAISRGKEIYCFMELTDDENRKMIEMCKTSAAKVHFMFSNSDESVNNIEGAIKLFKINVPVLYFCEEVPDCDGYDVFLKLTEYLRQVGKNVLAVSEDKYNSLFGHYFLNFDAKSTIKNTIFRINYFIHDLEMRTHPDIICIKLPSPLMQFDEQNVFDCGGSAYLTAQAVPGDGCVYCTHATPAAGDFWIDFSKSILIKFGFPLTAVHVSNRLIDSTGDRALGTIRIPQREVLASLEGLNDSANMQFSYLMSDDELQKLGKIIVTEYFDFPYGVIQ